jgi:hypothetical protein
MEISQLLPKLTIHQKAAAEKLVGCIGFDLFIKSAIFRAMHRGVRSDVMEELEKWSKKISPQEIKEIKTLWTKLG